MFGGGEWLEGTFGKDMVVNQLLQDPAKKQDAWTSTVALFWSNRNGPVAFVKTTLTATRSLGMNLSPKLSVT